MAKAITSKQVDMAVFTESVCLAIVAMLEGGNSESAKHLAVYFMATNKVSAAISLRLATGDYIGAHALASSDANAANRAFSEQYR